MRLRPLLALLFVSGCRCAELPPGAIFACGPSGECPDGLVCIDTFCVTALDAGCLPSRQCTAEECGVVGDDGCGAPLDCGQCQSPFTCDLLEPNRCGCIPFDAGSQVCPASDAGATACGRLTVNNCGTFETFDCGPDCPGGFACSENLCCAPPAVAELCQSAKFGCGIGSVRDRCGTLRPLDCGTCSVTSERCIYDDDGSHCAAVMCVPETDGEMCDRLGANCGTVADLDNCVVARAADCQAPCDAGECDSTQPNQCRCQPVLSGCLATAQCCSGLSCNKLGRCCSTVGRACNEDGECCSRSCQLGACCAAAGSPCVAAADCCSGACGLDGGCEYVDAGMSAWDAGEL